MNTVVSPLAKYQAPKFLISATLLFWGYLIGTQYWAVIMVVLLELKPFINRRFQLENNNFYLIGNISTVLFLIVILVVVFGTNPQLFIHQVIALLPIVFYPLLLAEHYSEREVVPLGAFIYRFRKRQPNAVIKISYIYFALSLLATSSVYHGSYHYFIILAFLISWALWQFKSPSNNSFVWVSLLLFYFFLSYLGQYYLMRLSEEVEAWAIDYFDVLFNGERDPFRSRTAIGKVGELKLSNKIVMRVKISDNKPLLLQEASYNSFYNNVWFSSKSIFKAIKNYPYEKTETIKMLVHRNTYSDKSLLALPLLTTTGLQAIAVPDEVKLSRTVYGTIRAINTKALFEYTIYDSNTSNITAQLKPDKIDLILSNRHKKVTSKIKLELGLDKLSDSEKISRIANYFQKNYRYSLYQEPLYSNEDAVISFLEYRHRGHCEFFATATVLLLRSVNIPARYVVGYSATEYDNENNLFTVRARDSHAWAQAYVNGEWLNVDNTPSTWYQAESANASIFEPVTDLFSGLYYKYKLWEKNGENESYQLYIVVLLIVLILIIVVSRERNNLWLKNKIIIRKDKRKNSKKTNLSEQQLESVMSKLVLESGVGRYFYEPLRDWQVRYENNSQADDELNSIISLYYKLRFASGQATETAIAGLSHKVTIWLNKKAN